MQTPLTLLLESLVLLLLVLAAARPQWRRAAPTTPLTLVLDDSFSMIAGAENAPREKAMTELEGLFSSANHYPVRFILAGNEPRVLAEGPNPVADLHERLRGWRCSAPSSDLTGALALAKRISLPGARLLVVTDHAPPTQIQGDPPEWWSLGKSLSNLAIVNASRTKGDGSDRCWLQIANYSPSARTLEVEVVAGTSFQKGITIEPGALRNFRFEVPAREPMVTASLPPDALNLDNRVWLARPVTTRVRVQVDLKQEDLSAPVLRALQAIEPVSLVDQEPHLLLTDRISSPSEVPSTWVLEFPSGNQGPSFIGPFALDRHHAVSEGLSLGGVLWQAASGFQCRGFPLISAGDTPLFCEEDFVGGHRFYLNFIPAGSTLQRSPNWPILLWNLVHMRSRALPGVKAHNIRLGTPIEVRTADKDREIFISGPDGETTIQPRGSANQLHVPAMPGIYEVTTGSSRATVAVNALSADESDLQDAAEGKWGTWQPHLTSEQQNRPLAGYFLIAAFCLLVIHAWFLQRQTGAVKA